MSYESIAIIILFGSLLGIGVIILRKVPILVELPEVKIGVAKETRRSKLKSKIQSLVDTNSFEIFLQKILSKFRILALKIENKTGNWLQRLREKSQKKKENDNYWKELKKSTNREKKSKRKKLPA